MISRSASNQNSQANIAMSGYYFVHTDIRNKRAHTAQTLHTVSAMSDHMAVALVAPRYAGAYDLEAIRIAQGLPRMPQTVLLDVPFFKRPQLFAFVAFNLSAIRYLLRQRKIGKNSQCFR